MSIEHMSAIWKIELKPILKFIFITLADNANEFGECFPSITYLSKKTGCGPRTINRAINELVGLGYLEKLSQFRTNGSCTTNLYRIKNVLPKSTTELSQTSPPLSERHPPPVTVTPPPRHSDTPYNPHIESSLIKKDKKIYVEQARRVSVDKIFDYWKNTHNHPKSRLDKKRKSKIIEAQKNYSDEDIYAAIDGCLLSPYHQGKNDNGQIYDDIELILRDSKHIEAFMARVNEPNAAEDKFIQRALKELEEAGCR